MTRKERERQLHQHEIVVAARLVFARKGFTETTMEDIATTAEFGKGTIYNYFDGKQELFRIVLNESFSEMLETVDHALQSVGTFGKKLESLVHDLLDYALSNPDTLFLMVRESHLLCNDNPLLQRVPELIDRIAEVIEGEQKKGNAVTDIDSTTLAQVLMNLILGRFTNIIHTKFGTILGTIRGSAKDTIPAILFEQIKTSDLRGERKAAAAVVRTIFLHGIASPEGN